jgi:serpin B
LLELPYAGTDAPENSSSLSMIVLLPKEKNGLGKLEGVLSEKTLAHWLEQARSQKVNVSLPRFKLTSKFSLGETLGQMGMPLPFSSRADFSGMDGAHDLFISAIVHKAYVDVNELGTEAAAATGITMEASAIMREKIMVFNADHPFIFLIRDNHSGSVLFLGRVADPTK